MKLQPTTQRRIPSARAGFTLIEMLLALSLIVVATGLIGFIMQMYSRNFAERGNDIRRKQLARAVLGMIAEDIRSVVLQQEYDGSVLEQQMGGGGGQESGGQDTGGQGDGGQDTGGGLASAAGGGNAATGTGLADDSSSADPAMADGDLMDATTAYPPGIYGDQYTLMVEVSRLPRQDEYIVQQTSLIDGTLNDVPGDIKTVLYYVQSATNQGVSDDLSIFGADPSQPQTVSGFSSGLVRRALDRGVTAYAEEMGDTDRLQRTGDLVAPEVIGLEFAYYDGSEAQWVYEWDSSQQSLPWLVQISLAIQSESGSRDYPIEAGTPINSLSYEDQRAYGIEVYELVVAIPGANLVAADAASSDAAAGMDSLGL